MILPDESVPYSWRFSISFLRLLHTSHQLAGPLGKIYFCSVMEIRVGIYYHYNANTSKLTVVDPDEYCYRDMVTDIYNTVTRHVPIGHNVRFKVKCILPNNQDLEVNKDEVVVQLFELNLQVDYINLYVYDLYVDERPFGKYTQSQDGVGTIIQQSQIVYGSNVQQEQMRGGSRRKHQQRSGGESFKPSSSKGTGGIETDKNTRLNGEDENSLEDTDSDQELEPEKEHLSDLQDDVRRDQSGNNVNDVHDSWSDYDSDEFYKPYVENVSSVGTKKNKLEIGMVFDDVNHFRSVLRDHVIQEGFQILRVKNEKTRLRAVCASEGCTWSIFASPCDFGATFMIKSMCNKHCCGRVDQSKNVTSTWVASHLAAQLRADPDMNTDAMNAYFMDNYRINVPYQTLYRAKKRASVLNEGNHSKSYARLPAYGEMILERNPGSMFKLQFYERTIMSDPLVFKRQFVSFKACVDGFLNGCRPFIVVDGCHLKGTYGGVLLVAVTVDGNTGLFPIAYGVVECECKES
ncbi:uncharacterized protein LOC122078072 [Macadamia integrifolia]|uniref:uncharacterized protein LOC122078072 n=1 Tax=Macadamia integrifolia TaxID=60698 RepID=UPI001C4F824D|nr:uncharacterized protein LOC122078072 [Macadamia integrifolia]